MKDIIECLEKEKHWVSLPWAIGNNIELRIIQETIDSWVVVATKKNGQYKKRWFDEKHRPKKYFSDLVKKHKLDVFQTCSMYGKMDVTENITSEYR